MELLNPSFTGERKRQRIEREYDVILIPSCSNGGVVEEINGEIKEYVIMCTPTLTPLTLNFEGYTILMITNKGVHVSFHKW